jgi:hypothetical protein
VLDGDGRVSGLELATARPRFTRNASSSDFEVSRSPAGAPVVVMPGVAEGPGRRAGCCSAFDPGLPGVRALAAELVAGLRARRSPTLTVSHPRSMPVANRDCREIAASLRQRRQVSTQ